MGVHPEVIVFRQCTLFWAIYFSLVKKEERKEVGN